MIDLAFEAQLGELQLQVAIKAPGPTLLLIGENASGKSSLLRCLLGLMPIHSGRIEIGESVFDGNNTHLPVESRKLGYVPQSEALFPHLDVQNQLAFALSTSDPGLTSALMKERIEEQLENWELLPFSTSYPHELSGGQRKRVALARALVQRPRALVLDEALSSLDLRAQEQVRPLLAAQLEAQSIPLILVTHEPADLLYFPAQIAELENGRVEGYKSLTNLESQLETKTSSLSPLAERLVWTATTLRHHASTLPHLS